MVEEVHELHLLLIEDNAGDAELFREYLDDPRGKRFRISHVTRLGHALTRIAENDVDLIILDLMLPDSEGIASIERIHRAAPRTPIVILSGIADDELGQRAIQVGAQDFLHKNALDSDSLARSLRYATERGRLQHQFRSLVENNADAIVVIDKDGLVTFINKAAEALFVRPRDEIVGKPFGYPIDGTGPSEIELRGDGDEPRAAEMRLAPIQWEGRSAWLASIRDVTDRKRAEDLQRRLYHADRLASIGQLASGVAHEINNPASFIRANLELLKEHMAVIGRSLQHPRTAGHRADTLMPAPAGDSELDDVVAESHQMIDDNLVGIDRISRIVKALSSFSRIEQDEVEQVDVNEVLEAACTMTFNEIRHRAALRKELSTIPRLAADRAKLTQVFTNLLINAAHAIEPGAADRNTIRVTTGYRGSELVTCIEDSGCGMTEEHITKIFTPFFTTKQRGLGTGLGLPLSADIIRKHGGHIRVTSQPGKGSRFEVVLPVETGMVLPKPPAPPPPRPVTRTRARVLVIDDEPMLLESIFRMLRRSHTVVLAEGGVAGVAQLEQDSEFDVLICDLMMPEVDGIKLYETVGWRWPELQERVIFCSGGAFAPEAKAFLSTVGRSNIVVEKPVTQKMMLDAVERVLERCGLLPARVSASHA